MSSSIFFVCLLSFSFIVSALLKKFKTTFQFFTMPFVFILIGYSVGPKGMHIAGDFSTESLNLLISLILGIIGFIAGLKFKRSFKGEAFVHMNLISGFKILIGGAAIFIIASLFSFRFYDLGHVIYSSHYEIPFTDYYISLELNDLFLWLSLTLASCLLVSSPNILTYLSKNQLQNGIITTVKNSSAFLNGLAIVAFGVILSASRAIESADSLGVTVTEWVMIAVLAGVISGVLFSFFIGYEKEEERVYLASIGAVIFASGAGIALGVSPLFVNFIFALVVSVGTKHVHGIEKALSRLEKPVFIVLFVCMGMLMQFEPSYLMAASVGYVVVRFILFKFAYNSYLKKTNAKQRVAQNNFGLSLLGQDIILISIAIGFYQRFPEIGNDLLLFVFVVIVINQLLAWVQLHKYLIDSGHHSLEVEEER